MLKEEIINTRNELNKMIEIGEKEEAIYEVSKKLDELIIKYYQQNTEGINWQLMLKMIIKVVL